VADSDVKAAYLYQFSKYVEWPETPAGQAGPVTMCVFGDPAVAAALQKIAGDEAASGRKVLVRQDSEAARNPDCHVVFAGSGEEQRLDGLIKQRDSKPTLTVGENAPFLRRGGMVAFIVQDRTVRFSVSLAAAQAAHLKISSQLLRHAVQVIQ
jgi:hypothetical protein